MHWRPSGALLIDLLIGTLLWLAFAFRWPIEVAGLGRTAGPARRRPT
jgi:hypothetical protein